MTWVRLDDEAMHHPKLLKAGPEAVCLWLAGLCYCNRYFTDGRIDKAFVVGLYAPVSRRSRRLSTRLVEMGLWIDRGDHFEVHDYAVYQQEALKEFAAERARDREVKRMAARERQRKSRANREGGASADTDTSRVTEAVTLPVTSGNGHAQVTRNVTASSRDHARPCAHAPVSRPGPSRSYPDQDLDPPAELGEAVAVLDRGNGSTTAATKGSERVSGEDAAVAWQRMLDQCNPGAGQPFSHWREDFELVAAVCNGVEAQNGRPALALQVVTEWFWRGPNGPIVEGRIKLMKATPFLFAKGISEDLASALAWWIERKRNGHPPHEAAP